MTDNAVDEVAIRYVITAQDDGTGRAVSGQKAVQDEIAKTNKVLRATSMEFSATASSTGKATTSITSSVARQASAVKSSSDVIVASQKKITDSLRAGADEWKVLADAATSADELIAKSRAEAAAATDKAAAKEIAALRDVGKTYEEIAKMAQDSAALRGRSAADAAAAVELAAKRERDAIRSPRPSLGSRTVGALGAAGSFAGRSLVGAGSLAMGGLGVAGYLTYEGVKKARGITESTLALKGSTGLTSQQAMALATIAQATNISPRSIGMAFNTLGGQLTKAEGGSKSSVEAFQRLGISRAEASKFKNNLPGLFDVVTQHAAKLPASERVAFQRQMLGRGTQVAGILTAAGPLEKNIKNVQGQMGGLNTNDLKKMQESFIQLQIVTTGLELKFVQAFGPTLTKLLAAAIPLVKPLGDALTKVVTIAVSAISALVSGPVGSGLAKFGKELMAAGGQLLKAFAPAAPFLKNVLLPLLKGVFIGVATSIIGAIKVAAPIIGLLAKALGWVGTALKPLKPVFEVVGKALGIVFSGAILKAIAVVGKAGEAIPLLGKAIGPLMDVVSMLGRVFTKVFSPLGTIFKLGFGVVVAAATTYWKTLTTVFSGGWQAIETGITAAWGAIKVAFSAALSVLTTIVTTWWTVVTTIWKTEFEIVKAIVTTAWKVITAVFTTAFKGISDAVQAVIGFISEHWKLLVPLLTGPFAPVVAVALNFGPEILHAIEDAFNSVIGFMSSLPGKFVHLGEGIIKGIVKGLEEAGGEVLKVLKSIPGVSLAEEALGSIFGGSGGGKPEHFKPMPGHSLPGSGNPFMRGLPKHAGGGWVPGDSHRDGTLALLSGNEFVLTGHGQSMMDSYAPGLLDHIAINQAPHFAEGGWVIKSPSSGRAKKPEKVNTYFDSKTGQTLHMTAKEHSEYTRHQAERAYSEKLHGVSFSGPVSTFGPPGEASGTTAYGGSSSTPGLALNPHGGANFNDALARSLAGKLFHVEVAGHSGNFKVIDKGPNARGSHGWRVGDITGAAARLMGFDPMKFPTDATGRFTEVVGGAAKQTTATSVKVPELAGQPMSPVAAFQTGFQAGVAGKPLEMTSLLKTAEAAAKVTMKSLGAGESAGSAAEAGHITPRSSRPKGIGARAWSDYLSMANAAQSILGKPYVYGGGHGSFNSTGYDCSGAVSYVLHAGGQTSTPLSTDGLKTFGLPGDGRLVTIGVRGTTGENAHTMMMLDRTGFESGGGGSQGKPMVHVDSGWDGDFPIHRHPPGLRGGGYVRRVAGGVRRPRPIRKFNRGGAVGMGANARAAVAGALHVDPKKISEGMLDPDSPRFVGFGLRRGGHVRHSAAARAPRPHATHVANRLHPHRASSRHLTHHLAAHHVTRAHAGHGKGHMGGALSGVASTLAEALKQLQEVSGPLEASMPAGVSSALAAGVGRAAGGAISTVEGASNTGPEANAGLSELAGVLDGTNKAVQEQLRKMAEGLKKQLAKLRAHHGKPAQIKGLESRLDDINQAVRDAGTISLQQLDHMAAGLKTQISHLKSHHGSKITIRRLESALGLVEGAVGQRVGAMVKQVNDEQRALERAAVARQQGNEIAGIEAGSSGAISSEISQAQLTMQVGAQQVGQLQGALAQAEQAGDTQDAEQIKQQIEGIQGAIQAAAVEIAKKSRELVEQQAREVTQSAEHNLSMVQGQMSLNQAVRSITNHGEESPAEMRQRAGELQSSAIPAMQAVIAGLQGQYSADLSVGDTKGAQEVQEKILAEQTDIANSSAEAANLMRQAAETQAHILTELAQHETNMAESGLQNLELHEKLAGTYDTGGTHRAKYINETILPALNKELAALQHEKAVAEEQGDAKLAAQIGEAIAGQQNKILEAQLQAQEDTKSATQTMANAMSNAGGSIGFQFNNQEFTDLIGVNVGM